MVLQAACPHCGSTRYKRNGPMPTGKQNHRCKRCGWAFVLVPENPVSTEAQWAVIARLLRERLSLRGIGRAMVQRFEAAPHHLYLQPSGGTPAVVLQRL